MKILKAKSSKITVHFLVAVCKTRRKSLLRHFQWLAIIQTMIALYFIENGFVKKFPFLQSRLHG